jgi:hypothetical protein
MYDSLEHYTLAFDLNMKDGVDPVTLYVGRVDEPIAPRFYDTSNLAIITTYPSISIATKNFYA